MTWLVPLFGVTEASVISIAVAGIAAIATGYGYWASRRVQEKSAEFERGLTAVQGFGSLTDQLQEELKETRLRNAQLQREVDDLRHEKIELAAEIRDLRSRILTMEKVLDLRGGGLGSEGGS